MADMSTALNGLPGDGIKAVALAAEMLQHLWKGVLQLGLGFQAVVKHDDGPRLRVGDYVLKALLTAQLGVEIRAEYIPHDDVVMALEEKGLAAGQPAVGGPEELCFCSPGALAHIVKIADIIGVPAVEMVVRMAAHRMALGLDGFQYFRVLSDIVAHAKKGAFRMVGPEGVEYPGGYFRDGPVVEGQVDHLFPTGDLPDKVWEKVLNKLRRLY